jgi:RNA polymerase sigma-70 factor, ECF subfamily
MATTKRKHPEQARFTEKEREFVYSVAMKYMKDEERANDVAQDAMMLAFQHRDSFRGDSRFTTWLYRIAATTALMHLRKQRRSGIMQSLSNDDGSITIDPGDPHSSPEEVSGASEAVRLAELHLAEMGVKYGEIFALRFVDGYSESEIAERLKLHVATVKTRAYRARTYLREQLERALATPRAVAA